MRNAFVVAESVDAAQEQCPWAEYVVEADGGYRCWESRDTYLLHLRQLVDDWYKNCPDWRTLEPAIERIDDHVLEFVRDGGGWNPDDVRAEMVRFWATEANH